MERGGARRPDGGAQQSARCGRSTAPGAADAALDPVVTDAMDAPGDPAPIETGGTERAIARLRLRGRLGAAKRLPAPAARGPWRPLVSAIEPTLADDRMIAARFGLGQPETGPPSDPDLPSMADTRHARRDAGHERERRRRNAAPSGRMGSTRGAGSRGSDGQGFGKRSGTVWTLVAFAAAAVALSAGFAAVEFVSGEARTQASEWTHDAEQDRSGATDDDVVSSAEHGTL